MLTVTYSPFHNKSPINFDCMLRHANRLDFNFYSLVSIFFCVSKIRLPTISFWVEDSGPSNFSPYSGYRKISDPNNILLCSDQKISKKKRKNLSFKKNVYHLSQKTCAQFCKIVGNPNRIFIN